MATAVHVGFRVMKYILTVDSLDYERIAAAIPNSISSTGSTGARTQLISCLFATGYSVSKVPGTLLVPVAASGLALATGATGSHFITERPYLSKYSTYRTSVTGRLHALFAASK